MSIDEILKKDINSFLKEKNENLYKYINTLVDEFDIIKSNLSGLFNEIENEPIMENYFYLDLKKKDFKKRAEDLESRLLIIEKRWGELILILNQRFK
jgi:hypothetical protein